MKNILALLVCLALALCCAVSLAEEGKTVIGDLSINGAFTLQNDNVKDLKVGDPRWY